MNLKTKIENREDFSLKFADAPFNSNNILNPGWAEPTYEDFFKRMVDEPVLLNQSTVLPMTALQHDLDMLTADVELDSQRDATGNSSKLTNNELSPNMDRKQLVAQPVQAKSVISDNFLEENIEGEDFLSNYMNLLADNMGPAFEMWGLYANTTATPVSGEGTGYNMTNGVLAQLQTVAADANNESKGIADLVYGNNVGEGILNAVQQYVEQDGNISNARIVLPPAVHSKFMLEIAKNKDTPLGDAVFQDGNITTLLGMEITADPILRKTKNGYGSMNFDNGVYKASGTAVDKMSYGFIGQPSNLVFGMMREFDVKNQWDIDVLGYKVALLCKGDVKVLWDQDTLAIPFTRNNQ